MAGPLAHLVQDLACEEPPSGVSAHVDNTHGEITNAADTSASFRSNSPDQEAGTQTVAAPDLESHASGITSNTRMLRPTRATETTDSRTLRRRRFLFRPFAYTEERLLDVLQNKDSAFQLATLVDNISLVLLGAGYIIASVLVFVMVPQSEPECFL